MTETYSSGGFTISGATAGVVTISSTGSNDRSDMSNIIEEQLKYFESWKSFLEASIGQRLSLEQEPNLPWLILPRHYDHHYFNIEGHEVVGWGEPIPYAEELVPCDGEGSRAIAAIIEDGRALRMAVDPRTVKYVQPHNGPGDDPRPNPGWLVLRAVEPFFKTWKKKAPERLEKIFMQIKDERLSWLDNQIYREVDGAKALENRLKDVNKIISAHRRAQITLRHISRKHFIEAAENWQGVIDNVGELKVLRPNSSERPTALRLTMPAFEIEGVQLGPYHISLDLSDLTVNVENIGGNKSWEEHHHPHVDAEGSICWGSSPRAIIDVINRANPLEILFCVADFLVTSYTPEGAFCRLSDWDRSEDEDDCSWYCEHCDVRHSDSESCPQWCSECEEHTNNWSEHHTCHEHYKCWEEENLDREHREDDPAECPQCRVDRLEGEAEEEETERLAEEEAARVAEGVTVTEVVEEVEGQTSTTGSSVEVGAQSEPEGDEGWPDGEGLGDADDDEHPDPDEEDASLSTGSPEEPDGYDGDCDCNACADYRQARDQTAAE